MPFFMTDMAAGSDAVRQMQNNIIGSQYDAQNAAAAAQLNQLKVKQAEQGIKAAELGNAVAEAGLKKTDEVKAAITKLQKSAGWADKSVAEQAEATAAALFSIDPIAASHMESYAANASLKEAQAALKRSDVAAERMRQFKARTDSVPVDRLLDYIAELPKPVQQALEKDTPGIMTERDPVRVRAMIDAASQTAAGHIAQENNAVKLQLQEIRREMAENRSAAQQLSAHAHRVAGDGGDSDYKKEKEAAKTIHIFEKDVDRQYQKQLDALDKEIADKKTALSKVRFFDSSEKQAVADAEKRKEDLERKIIKEKLTAIKRYPKTDARDEAIDFYEEQLKTFSQEKEPPAKEKPAPETKAPPTRPAGIPADAQQAPDGFWYTKDAKTGKYIKHTPAAN